MEQNDKIFDQFKKLAESNDETKFSAMEKVWERVEDKLDHKVLKKETKTWKKIAVAASILLVFSIGYQFLKEEQQTPVINNSVVAKPDSVSVENNEAIVSNENSTENPEIVENPDEVLNEQLNGSYTIKNDSIITTKPETVAVNDEPATIAVQPKVDYSNTASSNTNSSWLADRNFGSRGVTQAEPAAVSEKEEVIKKSKSKGKKNEPILVLDDKVKDNYEISTLDEDEIESIIRLPNPLYIINGEYFSEQELFGPNPTSLYAPLNKQKIETISILQDEKAISIYGEKGKNGVVIITTKDGKPIPKKR
jgi:TonB-dependent SusC/RagA subfamily outer membrane receptor